MSCTELSLKSLRRNPSTMLVSTHDLNFVMGFIKEDEIYQQPLHHHQQHSSLNEHVDETVSRLSLSLGNSCCLIPCC